MSPFYKISKASWQADNSDSIWATNSSYFLVVSSKLVFSSSKSFLFLAKSAFLLAMKLRDSSMLLLVISNYLVASLISDLLFSILAFCSFMSSWYSASAALSSAVSLAKEATKLLLDSLNKSITLWRAFLSVNSEVAKLTKAVTKDPSTKWDLDLIYSWNSWMEDFFCFNWAKENPSLLSSPNISIHLFKTSIASECSLDLTKKSSCLWLFSAVLDLI